MSYSNARANLAKVMDRVVDDCDYVVITRRNRADTALISAAELSSLLETAYLLSSPKNAKRLLTALNRSMTKKLKPTNLKKLREDLGL